MAIKEHPHWESTWDIIIGKPLSIDPDLFGLDDPHTFELRFLPKILVELGIAKSTSDIKRNRPDLWVTFGDNEKGFFQFKLGKERITLLVLTAGEQKLEE